MKTLQEIRNRISEIRTRSNEIDAVMTRFAAGENVEGVDFESLSTEATNLRNESVALRAEETKLLNSANFNERSAVVPTVVEDKSTNLYDSMEYRKQFQEYMRSGKIGELLKRADATTTQADATAVIIPTTITSQLFVTDQQAGTIFDRVTKTNYKFGVEYPISASTFKLSWLAERSTADKNKGESKTKISFVGYKGQIQYAISYEANITTLPDFEKAMAQKMLEGIRLSFDEVIIAGDGVGKPKGILSEGVYTAANTAQFNAENISSYQDHLKAFAKLPLSKKGKAVLVINNTDWLSYLVGIKDNNDRVVAFDTVGFGGMPQPVFMGRPVVVLEDQGLSTFDAITGAATASKTTCFGFWAVLEDYYLNMNDNMTTRKYIDEATDDLVTKTTLLADGKMISTKSIVTLTKKAASAS